MAGKISFLLGAGISIPAGFSTTNEITSRILSGEGIIHHDDSTYYFDNSLPIGMHNFDVYVNRVILLLKKLLLEINNYYLYDFNAHCPNYEDLYYVVNQLHDSELREYENPVVGAFLEKIILDIWRINSQNYPGDASGSWDLNKLLGEAQNYIRDVVWRMLQKEITKTDHLKSICDACLDQDIEKVDIFTLNHDLLLETALNTSSIPYNIGFSKQINHVRYWHPKWFEKNNTKVRLLKLHGSIDWFIFPSNEYSYGPEATGISDSGDIWHTVDPNGNSQTPAGGRPIFLAGTFNKMLHYTSAIFADLHYLFRQSIRSVEDLIVCGYGFGDKGINSQIIEWMSQSSNKHLTLIHKDPRELRQKSRGAIMNNWNDWERQGRLSIIEAFIEDVSWQDIKLLLKAN